MTGRTRKARIISSGILIDILIGACVGFFILHPLSMIFQHGKGILDFPIKHFLGTIMSLYFTLVGLILGSVSGFFRLKLKQKNEELNGHAMARLAESHFHTSLG